MCFHTQNLTDIGTKWVPNSMQHSLDILQHFAVHVLFTASSWSCSSCQIVCACIALPSIAYIALPLLQLYYVGITKSVLKFLNIQVQLFDHLVFMCVYAINDINARAKLLLLLFSFVDPKQNGA